MTTLLKTHKSEVAAKGHLVNIKKRGGTGEIKKQGAGYIVTYSFPSTKLSKKTTTENYKGYKISITTKKVIVWSKSDPKKQMFTSSTIEDAKRGLDSWIANVECSNRINSAKLTSSPNPNVHHKGMHH